MSWLVNLNVEGYFSTRPLYQAEITLAKSVFGDTIDFDKVRLVNEKGFDDRAFALVSESIDCDFMSADTAAYVIGLTDPMFAGRAALWGWAWMNDEEVCTPYAERYFLFIGETHFDANMASGRKARNLLIHELVHVWQGEYGAYPSEYMVDSICDQMQPGSAYEFKAGREWQEYGPEQQGMIVESWFDDGANENENADARFRYIRDNIRAGETVSRECLSRGMECFQDRPGGASIANHAEVHNPNPTGFQGAGKRRFY